MSAEVSIVRCPNYEPHRVSAALRNCLDLLGGITKFVKPGSRVLVKPNLLMAAPPGSAVVTHPQFCRGAIRLLKEIGCRIIVGDGPSVWGNQIEDVDNVYEVSGIREVCQDEGVELVKLDKRRMRQKFPMSTYLDECDCLVNLPKFKTHEFTILTGAIKNLFGLVSGTFKTELHKNYYPVDNFASILVDILQEARPSISIVDGISAMEADGPGTGGKVRHLGLIFASSDAVALDSILALIMGLEPLDIPATKEAAKRKVGEASQEAITVLGESLEDLDIPPFILPSSTAASRIPVPIARLARKFIRYLPYSLEDKCIRCQACVKACPKKIIRISKAKIVFDYSGCISCFCCQEVCPAAAIKIRKSLLAKMIGL